MRGAARRRGFSLCATPSRGAASDWFGRVISLCAGAARRRGLFDLRRTERRRVGDALEQHALAGRRAGGRRDELDLGAVGALGAEHHALRLEALHLRRLREREGGGLLFVCGVADDDERFARAGVCVFHGSFVRDGGWLQSPQVTDAEPWCCAQESSLPFHDRVPFELNDRRHLSRLEVTHAESCRAQASTNMTFHDRILFEDRIHASMADIYLTLRLQTTRSSRPSISASV